MSSLNIDKVYSKSKIVASLKDEYCGKIDIAMGEGNLKFIKALSIVVCFIGGGDEKEVYKKIGNEVFVYHGRTDDVVETLHSILSQHKDDITLNIFNKLWILVKRHKLKLIALVLGIGFSPFYGCLFYGGYYVITILRLKITLMRLGNGSDEIRLGFFKSLLPMLCIVYVLIVLSELYL